MIDLSSFSHLLVRSPNPLGDACMSLPALRAIKHQFDLRITVACRENLLPLWETQDFVDQVIGFSPKLNPLAIGKKIREDNRQQEKYQLGLLLPNSLRSALELRFSGCKHLIGYRGHQRAFLLRSIVKGPKKEDDTRHHVDRYFDLARHLGVSLSSQEDRDHMLALPPPPTPISKQSKTNEYCLGLCPGAEYGNAKRYPVERYANAIEILRDRLPQTKIRARIFGSPNEKHIGEELASLCSDPVENRVGETSIRDLIEELQQCHLLATNDTGTMHLAAALGVPTVAIFGSTDPNLSGPLGTRNRIIRHPVDCSPCFKRECPIDYPCMLRIDAETVAQEMEAILTNNH